MNRLQGKKVCKIMGTALLLLLAWRAFSGVLMALNAPEPQTSVEEYPPGSVTYLYADTGFLYRGWASLTLGEDGGKGMAGMTFHVLPHLIFEVREIPEAVVSSLPEGQGEESWEFGEAFIGYALSHLWEAQRAVVFTWPSLGNPAVWISASFVILVGVLLWAAIKSRQR